MFGPCLVVALFLSGHLFHGPFSASQLPPLCVFSTLLTLVCMRLWLFILNFTESPPATGIAPTRSSFYFLAEIQNRDLIGPAPDSDKALGPYPVYSCLSLGAHPSSNH